MTEEIIEKVPLLGKAKELYTEYAIHVIEDRAIYALLDGLKPVTRRLLWATSQLGVHHNSKFVKAARIAGETMGKYHPHGTAAIEGALATAVNQRIALFDGSGNWGTMVDPPAAARYTECRLSKYADKVFFDKFYANGVKYSENYDGSDKEPILLPALLPNAITNGNFGIAPGVRTETPTFTMESVVRTLIAILKAGGVATPKLCMGLEFVTEHGGVMRQTPSLKEDLMQFYETGQGKFIFDSSYKLDEKTNSIRIEEFAPISSLDGKDTKTGYKPGILDKIATMQGVQTVRDDSSIEDRYNAYVVVFSKTLKGQARDAVIKKIMDLFSASVNYSVQVIDRRPHPDYPYGYKKLLMSNIPDMINAWLSYRIKIEKEACEFWIDKREKQIDHLELMILAVKNRSFIIKALDKKLDDKELSEYIAKNLKITVEQANVILDLKVRQLKALEEDKLNRMIDDLEDEIDGYEDRIARPKSYVAKHIVGLLRELA